MKKSMIFAAAAALTLVACAKVETFQSTNDNDVVSFGVYASNATKATYYGDLTTATLGSNDNDYGFGVFAYYTKTTDVDATFSPNFMYNQQVIYDDTKDNTIYPNHWYYTPLKYWPNGQNSTAVNNTTHNDKLSFYAYAPYTAVGDSEGIIGYTPAKSDVAGLPVVTYVLPNTAAKQVDLLWATPITNVTKQSISGDVKFVFHHALSKINFKVQAVADKTDATSTFLETAKTKIILTKLEVFGTFATKNDLSLVDGSWKDPATTTNDGTSAYVTYDAATPDFATTTYGTITGFNVTETATDLNAAKALTVIPVDMAAGKFKVQATYYVVTADNNLEGGYSVVQNVIYTTTDAISFAQNKVNNITVKIGVTSIKLDAEVADWDNTPVNSDIHLPQNNS